MERTFRVTDLFHKVGDTWTLMHSHVSVPIDPATGQGLTNVKS